MTSLGSLCKTLPFTYLHKACAVDGRFRRSWVVPELTEQNWDHSGVLYYDETRIVTYSTVQRFEQYGEKKWQISRNRYVEGRFEYKYEPRRRYPVLTEAIQTLTAEVEASRSRHGPVPFDEWPESADSHWIIISRRPHPRPAPHTTTPDPTSDRRSES